MTIENELIEAVGFETDPDEDKQQMLSRLVREVDLISDDKWESLSPEAQKWQDMALTQLEGNDDISGLDGVSDNSSVDEDTDDINDSEDEPEEVEESTSKIVEGLKEAVEDDHPETTVHVSKKVVKTVKQPLRHFIEKNLNRKIRLVVKQNPKKRGTKAAQRFELYRDGMTVKEVLNIGVTRGDIKWDFDHTFIDWE